MGQNLVLYSSSDVKAQIWEKLNHNRTLQVMCWDMYIYYTKQTLWFLSMQYIMNEPEINI